MNDTNTIRPLRVLLLSPVAEMGGAERMLLDIIAAWRSAITSRQIDVHVLTLGDGPLVPEARNLGATVHVAPVPQAVAALGDFAGGPTALARAATALPGLNGLIRDLRQVVRQVRPDVIHSNGAKTHVLSRWMVPRGAASSRPVIVWHVHDFLGRRPLLARGLRRFGGKTSAAIAVSDAVAHDLRKVLPRTPIVTLLNGIDVDHFSPGRADPFVLDDDSNVVRIGLVATYARWKGHDVFLRAIAKAATLSHAGAAPVRYYIVGGPIYRTAGSQFSRAELEAMARELNVSDRVRFIDFQPDPLAVYRALDVVVHASTAPEPFGRTIAEAMASGRAVIVSAGGGARELVRDGVDAITVTPGDVMALAQTMRRVADDASLRQRLGVAARQTAVARFDRRRLGPALLDLYRERLSTTYGGRSVSPRDRANASQKAESA
jgi:glycosyltransferase involved in cell wall biosynthesis